MTKALDAAIRAAKEEWHRADSNLSSATRAALRAALPAAPEAKMVEYLRDKGFSDGEARAAWKLIRGHLLGEDA